MANESIRAAFELMWAHVNRRIGSKANADHTHDYAEENHTHGADEINGGTFSGFVYAKSNCQDSNVSCLRNSKLVATDTDPTVNGEINWTYG